MAEEGRPVYCGNCGSTVQGGDLFCGVCGSRIPPDAQDAAPTREIPTLVQPPPAAPAGGRNRSLFLVAVVGTLLLVSLVGAGAMVLTGLGPGAGLLGGAEGGPTPSGGGRKTPVAPRSRPTPPSTISCPT